MKRHVRTEIVQVSTARWFCRCRCGHETPETSSKRNAVQAYEVHEAWPDGPEPAA